MMPMRGPGWWDELPEFLTEAEYRLHAVHRSALEIERPVRLTLPIADLVTP